MALPAGGEGTSCTATATTETAPSAQPICRRTTTTRVSGEKYGANTGTSSTRCNVSETDRQVEAEAGAGVVYMLTGI